LRISETVALWYNTNADEKAILALSRSKITADRLAKWLADEPEEGLTFEEVMVALQ
jgi:hypothetical protein